MKHCDICNLDFENSREYSNHVRWQHTEEKFHSYLNCTYCNKTVPAYVLEKHENSCYKKPDNIIYCKQCGSIVKGYRKQFCNQTCSAMYNNTHKTTGTRRSKLERYIESQLSEKYPNLVIQYNKTSAIEAELDIYIPSLSIAFELNGIYHYEPIHGSILLNKIQNNDKRKFQLCLSKNIEFCIIDTSKQIYFKEDSAKIYLDIIVDLINEKMIIGDIV